MFKKADLEIYEIIEDIVTTSPGNGEYTSPEGEDNP